MHSHNEPPQGLAPLLTSHDVARFLGVKPDTLASWRSSGKGPTFVKLGEGRTSSIRYRREDVEAFVRGAIVAAEAAS